MISVEKEYADMSMIGENDDNNVMVTDNLDDLVDFNTSSEINSEISCEGFDELAEIIGENVVDVKVSKPAKAEKKKNTKKAKNGKKVKPSEKVMTTAKKVSELSMSLEDYLEKIYLLSLEYEEVRVTDIAEALSLSKPSVNRAVNNLTALGYITHAHYGSIELTDIGHSTAKGIYKKHKVIKQFLMQCLGVDKTIAESEAYNLKHFISKGTCKKLKNFLSEF